MFMKMMSRLMARPPKVPLLKRTILTKTLAMLNKKSRAQMQVRTVMTQAQARKKTKTFAVNCSSLAVVSS